jgi:hypothetical protein
VPIPQDPRRASGVSWRSRTPTESPNPYRVQPSDAERRGRRQLAFPDPGPVQPADLVLGGYRAVSPRRKGARGRPSALDQRDTEAVRIGEGECRITESFLDWINREPAFFEPRAPERQAPSWNLEARFNGETVTDARRCRVSPGEERQVGAWMSLGVGVEQMIGPGIVLVHAALDQPHPEHARVEVEILLRGTGDRRDVVQTVNAGHAVSSILRLRCLVHWAACSHSPGWQ